MNPKIRSLLFACMGLLSGLSVIYIYNNFIAEKRGTKNREIPSEFFKND